MLPKPEVMLMTRGLGALWSKGRNAVVTMATEVRFVLVNLSYVFRRAVSELSAGRLRIPALLMRTVSMLVVV